MNFTETFSAVAQSTKGGDTMKNVKVWLAGIAAAIMLPAGLAIAQEDWPPSQMTVVVSHDIGSSQNVTMRALGEVWQEKLGTRFVYENREGASGRVGYDYFLGRPADGTTILSSNLGSASIMYAQQNPPWDWREVLQPLGIFGVDPGAIFVRSDSEWQDLNDVVEAAKESPLTLGLSFWASPENLQLHQIMGETGAQFEVVPNSNSSDIMAQVLGGHVDVGYSKVGSVRRAGDGLRIIAVPLATNPVPDITNDAPTADEALGIETMGVASYRGVQVHKEWADANPDKFQILRDTFVESLSDPRFIEAMGQQGVDEDLIYDIAPDEIYEEILDRYWSAFELYGDIYD